FLEVLPRAERAATSGQHDAAHGIIVSRSAYGVAQGDLGGDVEAVHRLGSVEPDGGDAVAVLDDDRAVLVGHDASVGVVGLDDTGTPSSCGAGPRTSSTKRRAAGRSRVACSSNS